MEAPTELRASRPKIREASRARAPDSPSPDKGRMPERPGQTRQGSEVHWASGEELDETNNPLPRLIKLAIPDREFSGYIFDCTVTFSIVGVMCPSPLCACEVPRRDFARVVRALVDT